MDLNEIAAAIERIDALLATSMASDIHSAVEKIQDIAFVLHERPVEQSLCDALDSAIREIADALVRPDGAAGSVRKAAELLHVLAARVSAMIAPSTEPAEAPAAVVADHESFAQAIAGLARRCRLSPMRLSPRLSLQVNRELVLRGKAILNRLKRSFPAPQPIGTPITPHEGQGSASEGWQRHQPSSENVLLDAFESNPFSRDQTPNVRFQQGPKSQRTKIQHTSRKARTG